MFYPMFALVVLTLAVLLTNLIMRIRAVRLGRVAPRYFKVFQGDAPAYLVAASRNYANLFEMPVLFYVAGILAMITNAEGLAMVALGWCYVLCRVLHSLIHLTSNHVYSRLGVFAASNVALLAMWLLLLWNLLAAGP